MTDAVTIVNLALMKLGKSTIVSLSDPTDEAEKANMAYTETRQRLLTEAEWPFAVKRQELGQLSIDPVSDFSYAYQLPTDCLKVLTINEFHPGTYPYRIEGRTLWTSAESIELRYIADITNTAFFSPPFRRAFIDQLAYDLSFYFRADKGLTQFLAEQAMRSKQDAIGIDTQQGSARAIYDRTLIDVRDEY